MRIARVEVTDDLNGKPAAETIRFGLDGMLYEIDLTTANAAKLRRAMLRYSQAGRCNGRVKTADKRKPRSSQT
jgi:hypothetical protein